MKIKHFVLLLIIPFVLFSNPCNGQEIKEGDSVIILEPCRFVHFCTKKAMSGKKVKSNIENFHTEEIGVGDTLFIERVINHAQFQVKHNGTAYVLSIGNPNEKYNYNLCNGRAKFFLISELDSLKRISVDKIFNDSETNYRGTGVRINSSDKFEISFSNTRGPGNLTFYLEPYSIETYTYSSSDIFKHIIKPDTRNRNVITLKRGEIPESEFIRRAEAARKEQARLDSIKNCIVGDTLGLHKFKQEYVGKKMYWNGLSDSLRRDKNLYATREWVSGNYMFIEPRKMDYGMNLLQYYNILGVERRPSNQEHDGYFIVLEKYPTNNDARRYLMPYFPGIQYGFETEEYHELIEAERRKQEEIKEAEYKKRIEALNEEGRKELVKKYGSNIGNAIYNGIVKIGMTTEMADLAWGAPISSSRAITKYGDTIIWIYGPNTALYFVNNKVVMILVDE